MTEQEKQARIQTLRGQILHRFFDPACEALEDPVLARLMEQLEELDPSPDFDAAKGLAQFWDTFEERKARIEEEG